MPLHARKMLPPVRELIEEHVSEVAEIPVEDVYERDPKTQVLVRVGSTPGGQTVVDRPTGKMVECYETIGEGDEVIVHEGSLKQVDLFCGDCGSLLHPGNDTDFYYLLCSRLNERAHDKTAWTGRNADGEPVVFVRTLPSKNEPFPNCVLECGNEPLGELTDGSV